MSEHAAGAIPPPGSIPPERAGERVAQAFDRWHALDRQLETLGPKAVSPETIAAAWEELLQRYEEWNLSR